MSPRPLSQARDPDLRSSQAAMNRAALRARQLATQSSEFDEHSKPAQPTPSSVSRKRSTTHQ